jgi:hypothetical protein
MCFNSNSEDLPHLYSDGVMLPCTDSFKYLGMVCDKQINLNTAADATLRPFTAGTFVQSQRVCSEFRNITLTGYTRTYGFSRHTLFRLLCMRVRFWLLLTYNKATRWTVPLRNGCWQCWKGCWGSETPHLHGVSCKSMDWNPYSSIGFARQCGCTILWLKFYSYTMKKVSHADMQLSTRSNDCWSAHILSAMDCLTQSYIFKQKLQNYCEPIDLSRFVLDLRERHLEYWAPQSETHPKQHNSKRASHHVGTEHKWCALPTKRALVTHSPYYILPKYMFSTASWCH